MGVFWQQKVQKSDEWLGPTPMSNVSGSLKLNTRRLISGSVVMIM